jgi:hypothetical protein
VFIEASAVLKYQFMEAVQFFPVSNYIPSNQKKG